MKTTPFIVPVIIGCAFGAALWYVGSLLSGRRELWDAPIYWSLCYPSSIVVAVVLGFFCPVKPWRWAVAVFVGQVLTMTVINGELGGLWPLGMILFAVLALPAIGGAELVGRFRRKQLGLT